MWATVVTLACVFAVAIAAGWAAGRHEEKILDEILAERSQRRTPGVGATLVESLSANMLGQTLTVAAT